MNQLDQKIEKKIKEEALRLTSVGRTNWDQRHTLCSVKWMKELIKNEGGDEKILIPTMYFHDTGYEKIDLGYNHQQCLTAKKGHAEAGAFNVKEFFPSLNYFTTEEIERMAYLVEHHDQHGNVTEHDRQLILEADGFAQIDWENCAPSYEKNEALNFLNDFYQKDRVPYIKTKFGKKILNELTQKAKNYFK